MANAIRDGREVALTEASLGEAIEKRDWIQLVNEQVPFHCLV